MESVQTLNPCLRFIVHRKILAKNAYQPESKELYYLGEVSVLEINISLAASKGFCCLYENEIISCAVKQILKSAVREIRTLRSVGVGAPIR